MQQRHQAPFRADVVGSFLRPDAIKQARQQFAQGTISAQQLRTVENEAIRQVVQQQCDCGLHVVTDGSSAAPGGISISLMVCRALSVTTRIKASSSMACRPKHTACG